MNDIPAKVVYVMGVEVGLWVGLSIIVFHSTRAVVTATRQGRWRGFRSL